MSGKSSLEYTSNFGCDDTELHFVQKRLEDVAFKYKIAFYALL